jgi:hypothetical protein
MLRKIQNDVYIASCAHLMFLWAYYKYFSRDMQILFIFEDKFRAN